MSILEKLLIEIRKGGTLDIHKLANRLDTSPQLVEAMLEHLCQTGILSAYESYNNTCGGCGLQQSCKSQENRSIRLWQYKPPS
jgi:Mn-dependent DtxR family transcriptional regulator